MPTKYDNIYDAEWSEKDLNARIDTANSRYGLLQGGLERSSKELEEAHFIEEEASRIYKKATCERKKAANKVTDLLNITKEIKDSISALSKERDLASDEALRIRAKDIKSSTK